MKQLAADAAGFTEPQRVLLVGYGAFKHIHDDRLFRRVPGLVGLPHELQGLYRPGDVRAHLVGENDAVA